MLHKVQQGGAVLDTYCVMLGQRTVGEVTVDKEGLYYVFCCRIALDHGEICRLILETEKDRIDLGILMPCNGSFFLKKKLPIKRICGTSFNFFVTNSNATEQQCRVEIRADQPFAHIDKLPAARLRFNGSKTEIIFQGN